MSTQDQIIVVEEEMGDVLEWFQIHGPSLLSASFFLLLLVFTQVAIPQHTPNTVCIFPKQIQDVFVWLLVPLCFLITGLNVHNTLMRNRSIKGKEASWFPSGFSVISAISLLMMTLSTLCYGFAYKFIPPIQSEGWILHSCSSFIVIRFSLIYGVFLLNAFLPMLFFRSPQ